MKREGIIIIKNDLETGSSFDDEERKKRGVSFFFFKKDNSLAIFRPGWSDPLPLPSV